MSGYVEQSISKGDKIESAATGVLALDESGRRAHKMELTHGEWITRAKGKAKRRTFAHPSFGLLVVFAILFAGSVYLFENMTTLVA